MRCPNCGSERVEKLCRGAKTGAAVGATAGKVVDDKALDNRKCNKCGHEWHVDD